MNKCPRCDERNETVLLDNDGVPYLCNECWNNDEPNKKLKAGDSLFLEGRAWFDKDGGNVYHTVRVWLNGKVVTIIPRRYGYENHYQTSAIETLVELGYLPETLADGDSSRETRDYPIWRIDRILGTVTYAALAFGKKSELFKED